MLSLFFNIFEAIKETVFLAEIVCSTPVFGFLPILLFLYLILKVPKEDIFNDLLSINELIISFIIVSTKYQDSDRDMPISLLKTLAISALVTLLFAINI